MKKKKEYDEVNLVSVVEIDRLLIKKEEMKNVWLEFMDCCEEKKEYGELGQ